MQHKQELVTTGAHELSLRGPEEYIFIDTLGARQSRKESILSKTDYEHLDFEVTCMCAVTSTIWIGDSSGDVRLYSVDTGELIKSFLNRGGVSVTVMRFARGHVWTGFADGVLHIYSARSNDFIKEAKLHKDFVTDLAVTVNTDTVYSCSVDSQICRWSTSSFMTEGFEAFGEYECGVRSLAFSSSRLFSGGDDSRIIEWNTFTRERIHVLELHSAPVLSLTVFNGFLWSGSSDGVVCIWSLKESSSHGLPECVHMITNPHEGAVTMLKHVGLKVWSISAGQLYVWNPATFELEAHCRIRKNKNTAFNVVEVIEEVVCSKAWVSYEKSGDIVKVQSNDILPAERTDKYEADFPGGDIIKKLEEKECIINELLKTQKTLKEEYQALQMELAQVQSQQNQKSLRDLPKLKMKVGHDKSTMTDMSDSLKGGEPVCNTFHGLPLHEISNEEILHGYSTHAENISTEKKSNKKIMENLPRYVVVDANALLEELGNLHQYTGKLLNSKDFSRKNSYVYFTGEKDSSPIPIGFISNAELNKAEKMLLQKICGPEVPYVLPPFYALSESEKHSVHGMILRVRPCHFVPSSASFKSASLILSFMQSTHSFSSVSGASTSTRVESDHVGYPPITFHLKHLKDRLSMMARHCCYEKKQFSNHKGGTDEKIQSDTNKCVGNSRKGAFLSDNFETPSLSENPRRTPEGSPRSRVLWRSLHFKDASSANHKYFSLDSQMESFVDSFRLIYNDLISYVLQHNSSRVRSCAFGFTQNKEMPVDLKNSLRVLRSAALTLMRRLCSAIEELETNFHVMENQSDVAVTRRRNEHSGDVRNCLLSPSVEEARTSPPGILSLISQMHTHHQAVHDLVINHLLEQGRRIALQYGRLMDALLQRHKPSSRPIVSWDIFGKDHDGSFSFLSVTDALDAYDTILEKVRTVEEVFFSSPSFTSSSSSSSN